MLEVPGRSARNVISREALEVGGGARVGAKVDVGADVGRENKTKAWTRRG